MSPIEGLELFEFQRTVSRLIEMGSQSYLALPHGPRRGPTPVRSGEDYRHLTLLKPAAAAAQIVAQKATASRILREHRGCVLQRRFSSFVAVLEAWQSRKPLE